MPKIIAVSGRPGLFDLGLFSNLIGLKNNKARGLRLLLRHDIDEIARTGASGIICFTNMNTAAGCTMEPLETFPSFEFRGPGPAASPCSRSA